MSSFVIDKKSYVRVGAIVAGINKALRGTNRELWFYDKGKNDVLKGWDFVEKFVECYNLNVESVCEQYSHDKYANPKTYEDSDDYMEEYIRYFKYGRMIAGDTLRMMDVIWDICEFSRSVSYQIENDVCNQIVMEWFNAVIAQLIHAADIQDEREFWGEFDLNLDKEKALD